VAVELRSVDGAGPKPTYHGQLELVRGGRPSRAGNGNAPAIVLSIRPLRSCCVCVV
jgi:hypothetical protein